MAKQIVWDTEERVDFADKEGHIRDTEIYLTAGLVASMDQEWGVFSYIRTSTDVETGEVTVGKAKKGDPGAVPVRRVGAQNAAVFSFWRPLKKLNLKVPEDRQFNVTPFTREVDEVGTVFVFPMGQRVSVPRNRREEAEFEAAAAKQPLEGQE